MKRHELPVATGLAPTKATQMKSASKAQHKRSEFELYLQRVDLYASLAETPTSVI